MLDGTTAPAGGEGAAAPITDERTAAAAFAGLIDTNPDFLGAIEGDEDGAAESGAEAPDAGSEETPTTGDEEGQSEPEAPAAPAIEPPRSWSDEDKALFGKLPPEAQTVIAQREGERDRLILQRTEEVAETRKAIEAERAAIQAQQQQHLQGLQLALQLALPDAKQFEGVDWARLSTENPAEYVRLSAQRDAVRERVQRIAGEMQRIQGEAQAESEKRLQGVLGEQRKLLIEKVPEFGDADKGAKLSKDLGDYLKSSFGFTDGEIGQVVDHRVVTLAVTAMRAHQAAQARQAAEAKKTVPAAPTVQKPGSAATTDGRAKQVQQKSQRLRQTGSVRDAAALFMDLIP